MEKQKDAFQKSQAMRDHLSNEITQLNNELTQVQNKLQAAKKEASKIPEGEKSEGGEDKADTAHLEEQIRKYEAQL